MDKVGAAGRLYKGQDRRIIIPLEPCTPKRYDNILAGLLSNLMKVELLEIEPNTVPYRLRPSSAATAACIKLLISVVFAADWYRSSRNPW
jgi:hypothetical protein